MKQHWFPVLLFFIIGIVVTHDCIKGYYRQQEADQAFAAYQARTVVHAPWQGPGADQLPNDSLVRYGYALVVNTAYYLGPQGKVAHLNNGMNCQHCHLQGGTLPFGNNFGKVYATYPQYRPRNNALQTIYDRVNDCLERSLNGQPLDSSTHEMKAIYAYLQWLGRDVPKGVALEGTSMMKLDYLDRAANPEAGKQIYAATCQRCHGDNGQGQAGAYGGFVYPPLWGPHSYNDGAGMYRLGTLAGFVRNNMPYGVNYQHPQLSEAAAWDVAAFINSQPRPHKDQHTDWEQVAQKPVDYPFGPYADPYTEQQHKYGPFKPIQLFSPIKHNRS
ncbi:thiosulfate dehydrogenase [Chitinophaga costaii]|uniref:Thiosulfate dehydrogenase n=1 Tax=Chitinophaga costaii TaxID=1335309 RepID=A0A1C4EFN0_9BACT|nr:c-type cytochrome [Chitinophaga costaii]PUZ23856.1 cytochrome C [Chitinophaga costaii]SCC42384.1 thiosulfate dehydrogenase [Chitinophaga costaii]